MEIISGHVLSNLKRIEGNCGSPIDVDEVEEVEVAADEEGSDEETWKWRWSFKWYL